MYLTPPITVEEFYEGARRKFRLPENEPQLRPKPRVSSISRDAREIAYMMSNTPITNPSRGDMFYSAEQGRIMEDATIAVLAERGYPVVDRQVELPDDYPLTGHPDGRMAYDGPFAGKTWGFEHKHFGRWAYEDIMKKGLVEASPEIVAQVSMYGDALGWDACLVIVTAQDASSVRSDMSRNKKAKNEYARWADRTDLDPKVMIFALDLHETIPAWVPYLKQRAKWFQGWHENDGNPEHVAWEIDPNMTDAQVKKNYGAGHWQHWNYSEWADRARASEQGHLSAPALPWESN